MNEMVVVIDHVVVVRNVAANVALRLPVNVALNAAIVVPTEAEPLPNTTEKRGEFFDISQNSIRFCFNNT